MVLCRPYFVLRSGRSCRARQCRGVQSASYTPLQVAKAYGLPGLTGAGQTIGIIELGGAYSSTDLTTYLQSLGLLGDVSRVQVIGSMQPDPDGADVEVMLDVCIIAAIATGSKIRVYFAPNTDAGFAGAVGQAVNECDVVSISWGAAENQWSAGARQSMDSQLQIGVSKSVNTYVASGDNGSGDNEPGNNTDYPSSSPYAIGCGGTNLQVNSDGTINSETVWNDGSSGGATGGGYSAVYPMPEFQKGLVNGSKRGVPDVSGVGDPETGWLIRANGKNVNVGGTSAVAPLWAAIQALFNQAAGKRMGPAAYYYQNKGVFNDTITGSNGAYNAGPGWDACTGLGSPKGKSLFALLSSYPPTPVPVPTPSPTPVPTPVPTPTPTPQPPPVHQYPTLQQALAVTDATVIGVQRQVGPYYRPIVGYTGQQVDKALTALWNAHQRSEGSIGIGQPNIDWNQLLNLAEELGPEVVDIIRKIIAATGGS